MTQPPPDQCHRLGHEDAITALTAEIDRMARVVDGADFTATVPTCPKWTLAQLVRHTARVHRWCAAMVASGSTEPFEMRSLELPAPDDTSEYAEWLGEGASLLARVFADAEPDRPVWSWSTDPHVRFWPRRMLHETVVHRADAELTVDSGAVPAVDARIAVDTVDEFFTNLAAARFYPGTREFRGDGEVLALAATDVDVHWRVEFTSDGFTTRHAEAAEPATTTLAGPAGEIALVVMRRLPPVAEGQESTVTGDREPLDRWLSVLAF